MARKIITSKKKYFQAIITLFALISGAIAGFLPFPLFFSCTKEITILFTNLLKSLSIPMIFLAIVSTITQMDNVASIAMLMKKIVKYTLLTTTIAATVGLLLFLFVHPTITPVENSLHHSAIGTPHDYLALLKKIVPDNLIDPFLHGNVLAVVFIATSLSFSLIHLPKKTSLAAKNLFHSLFEAILFLTSKLIYFMPIAIFSFTVQFTHNLRQDRSSLSALFWYACCIVGSNCIQGILVLPLILKSKRLSPIRIAKKMAPAIMLAFLSKSSNTTLPVSLDCAINRLRISNQTARFSLPLCSVINMNGCAAFILITVLFACRSYGIVLNAPMSFFWIVMATLLAIGNAGVPMGCFFLTSACLMGLGLPLDIMGMILPLYTIFDMIETMLNVWSDSCVTAIVDREIERVKSPISAKESLSNPSSV